MKNTYNGYKVTSSHGTGTRPASVRVRSPEGVWVARMEAKRGDVLRHVRLNPLSDEAKTFRQQLLANDVPMQTVFEIMQLPKKGG
jgi:hypothetical protein